jgi:hypothetical protein
MDVVSRTNTPSGLNILVCSWFVFNNAKGFTVRNDIVEEKPNKTVVVESQLAPFVCLNVVQEPL